MYVSTLKESKIRRPHRRPCTLESQLWTYLDRDVARLTLQYCSFRGAEAFSHYWVQRVLPLEQDLGRLEHLCEAETGDWLGFANLQGELCTVSTHSCGRAGQRLRPAHHGKLESLCAVNWDGSEATWLTGGADGWIKLWDDHSFTPLAALPAAKNNEGCRLHQALPAPHPGLVLTLSGRRHYGLDSASKPVDAPSWFSCTSCVYLTAWHFQDLQAPRRLAGPRRLPGHTRQLLGQAENQASLLMPWRVDLFDLATWQAVRTLNHIQMGHLLTSDHPSLLWLVSRYPRQVSLVDWRAPNQVYNWETQTGSGGATQTGSGGATQTGSGGAAQTGSGVRVDSWAPLVTAKLPFRSHSWSARDRDVYAVVDDGLWHWDARQGREFRLVHSVKRTPRAQEDGGQPPKCTLEQLCLLRDGGMAFIHKEEGQRVDHLEKVDNLFEPEPQWYLSLHR